RKGAAPLPEADDAKVHLELLDREAPRFSGYRRNIFSPIFKEEVKLPPFKPLPPPPRPVLPLPPPPPAPPAPAPAPPPAPTAEDIAAGELAKFTFLGFLKKNGERTVFLSSNNEIFLAKKGSNLGTKFQVTDLTEDAITIKSVAGGRELVIPLLENRALSTRRTSQRP
ncbi:MAG TPA: type II secretion system protein PulP, partial [Geomonas sp.]